MKEPTAAFSLAGVCLNLRVKFRPLEFVSGNKNSLLCGWQENLILLRLKFRVACRKKLTEFNLIGKPHCHLPTAEET